MLALEQLWWQPTEVQHTVLRSMHGAMVHCVQLWTMTSRCALRLQSILSLGSQSALQTGPGMVLELCLQRRLRFSISRQAQEWC
jgi:hypothetical protein